MPFNLLSIYQLYQKLSLERQREGKIARAKNSGGAVDVHIRQAQCKGAAPEQARPKAELTH